MKELIANKITAVNYAILSGGGGSPVQGINQLKDMIQDVVVAAGVVLALFGIVQVGISLSQHDSQQRINGFLFLAGGIIVASAPTILSSLGIGG